MPRPNNGRCGDGLTPVLVRFSRAERDALDEKARRFKDTRSALIRAAVEAFDPDAERSTGNELRNDAREGASDIRVEYDE